MTRYTCGGLRGVFTASISAFIHRQRKAFSFCKRALSLEALGLQFFPPLEVLFTDSRGPVHATSPDNYFRRVKWCTMKPFLPGPGADSMSALNL